MVEATKSVSVASMNGAPAIAPTATSMARASREKKMATTGNQRLGERGSDGGEKRSDRPLRELQAVSGPFDSVREELGADEDDDESDEQAGDVFEHAFLRVYRGKHIRIGERADRVKDFGQDCQAKIEMSSFSQSRNVRF